VGPACTKDAGCAGCAVGVACVACAVERRRFVDFVQDEDDRVRAAHGAGRDTYCALYDTHWRAQAHRLLRKGMLLDKVAVERAEKAENKAENMAEKVVAEPEPELEFDHSSPRGRLAAMRSTEGLESEPFEREAGACTIS
jgi:hypothetical protein